MSVHDAQLLAVPPIPFRPAAAAPAFAVMETTGSETSEGDTIVGTKKYAAGPPSKALLVNGPSDVAASDVGTCSTALGVPVLALADTAISAGDACGPTDGNWGLSANYPGFVAVAASSNSLVLVLRQPENTRCKGLAVGAVGSSDTTFTIDNVTAYSGMVPVANSSDTLTVQNLFSDNTDDNGNVTVTWNRTDEQWEVDDIECPA